MLDKQTEYFCAQGPQISLKMYEKICNHRYRVKPL